MNGSYTCTVCTISTLMSCSSKHRAVMWLCQIYQKNQCLMRTKLVFLINHFWPYVKGKFFPAELHRPPGERSVNIGVYLLACFVLQSGGDLENDERLADRIMNLVHKSVQLVHSPDKTSSFKRISGIRRLISHNFSFFAERTAKYTVPLTLVTAKCSANRCLDGRSYKANVSCSLGIPI